MRNHLLRVAYTSPEKRLRVEQRQHNLSARSAAAAALWGCLTLLSVLSDWGSTPDPCAFIPPVECREESLLLAGGAGSSLMSGASSGSNPSGAFEEVFEEWGFDNWYEAVAWMQQASPQDVVAFIAALTEVQ